MDCAQKVIDVVVSHARREAPAECCGVLIGDAAAIAEALPTGNLSENPNRFLIDPKGHLDALRQARALGLDVIGFYHSHPHTAARPSERDLAEVSYPDLLMMIVSVQSASADVQVFRMAGDRFAEVPISSTG